MEKININRDNELDLQKIIHIGPVRSKKIISRRPFKDVYEISNVLGLGKKRIDDIIKQNIIIVK